MRYRRRIGAVLTRRAFEVNLETGVSIDGVTAAFQRVSGAVLVMVVLFWLIRSVAVKPVEGVAEESRERFRKSVPWVIVNALCGMVFGVACFQWALQHSPTAIVLSIVALTPLFVIPMSWIINRDCPSLLSVIGGMIAVSGVLLLLSA